MGQLKIEPARPEEFEALAALAERIWREHYTPIIGAAQVEYMLRKFQSPAAMREQVAQGMRYCGFFWDGAPAGYLAVKRGGDRLFLSKIYVEKSYRGKKIARGALGFLDRLCRERGLGTIWLTVNKNNAGSIAAYRALGFSVARSLVTDIGEGFVMDDYVMERPVPAEEE